MDNPGSHEFSQSIVNGFFDQAETTISTLKETLHENNLPELAALADHLKGIANTLGAVEIKANALKIKNLAMGKDEQAEDGDFATVKPSDNALSRIGGLIEQLEQETKSL
ncbi:hypothetical protein GGR57DRAFT_508981 [Xylariaceae sp. FL1272]|nr:hypothetical protein GGR57DRAFT_508981 [Xylariaceae sp. FL1272]